MRRLRRTHKTAKIAASIKEVSPKMLPRSGQKGRTSHEQLGFATLTAKIMAVTQISSLFMEQLNHLGNSLHIPLSSPGASLVFTGVKN